MLFGMNMNAILSELDREISRLTQVRQLLSEAGEPSGDLRQGSTNDTAATESSDAAPKRGRGRPKGSTNKSAKAQPEASAPRRVMSPEGKARIAEAQRLRWARQKGTASATVSKAGSAKPATPAQKRRGRPASAGKKAAVPPAGRRVSAAKTTAKQASGPRGRSQARKSAATSAAGSERTAGKTVAPKKPKDQKASKSPVTRRSQRDGKSRAGAEAQTTSPGSANSQSSPAAASE